ncbi:hypothetical protein SCMC78_62660 [Streptomyces sp. CMC78]|uniref:HTH hxlR-type domain-containing protein n=1 Tax=Streptomyces sp. CMC78 TaxID=3231512 RepID=A0AB33KRJ2_9ACTN
MATPGLPPTFSIASIDAQRVEEALARIGPKWTTWTAMTLAQVRGPVRVRDVAAQLPFVSEQFVGKRLATMHADGLVVRGYDRRGAPYQLSARHVSGPRPPHGLGLVPHPPDTGTDGRSRACRGRAAPPTSSALNCRSSGPRLG